TDLLGWQVLLQHLDDLVADALYEGLGIIGSAGIARQHRRAPGEREPADREIAQHKAEPGGPARGAFFMLFPPCFRCAHRRCTNFKSRSYFRRLRKRSQQVSAASAGQPDGNNEEGNTTSASRLPQ